MRKISLETRASQVRYTYIIYRTDLIASKARCRCFFKLCPLDPEYIGMRLNREGDQCFPQYEYSIVRALVTSPAGHE
jgi:hypothetical protein